jgi:hypothetical protein
VPFYLDFRQYAIAENRGKDGNGQEGVERLFGFGRALGVVLHRNILGKACKELQHSQIPVQQENTSSIFLHVNG